MIACSIKRPLWSTIGKIIVCCFFQSLFFFPLKAQLGEADRTALLNYWSTDPKFTAFSETVRYKAVQTKDYQQDLRSCVKYVNRVNQLGLFAKGMNIYNKDRRSKLQSLADFLVNKNDFPTLKENIYGKVNPYDFNRGYKPGQEYPHKDDGLSIKYAKRRKEGFTKENIYTILIIDSPKELNNALSDAEWATQVKELQPPGTPHPGDPAWEKKADEYRENKLKALLFERLENVFWESVADNAYSEVNKEVTRTKNELRTCDQLFTNVLEKATKELYESGSVVGTWQWSWAKQGEKLQQHGSITFHGDGTMTWDGGSWGTWTQTGTAVTLEWKDKKFKDIMNLTGEGKVLSGVNNEGWQVEGKR